MGVPTIFCLLHLRLQLLPELIQIGRTPFLYINSSHGGYSDRVAEIAAEEQAIFESAHDLSLDSLTPENIEDLPQAVRDDLATTVERVNIRARELLNEDSDFIEDGILQ